MLFFFFSILLLPTLLFSLFFIFVGCCYCINISGKFASGLVVFLEDCICKNPNSVAVKNLSFESPKAKKMKNAVHEGDSTSFYESIYKNQSHYLYHITKQMTFVH